MKFSREFRLTLGLILFNLLALWILSHRFEFRLGSDSVLYRCNRLTGATEWTSPHAHGWQPIR